MFLRKSRKEKMASQVIQSLFRMRLVLMKYKRYLTNLVSFQAHVRSKLFWITTPVGRSIQSHKDEQKITRILINELEGFIVSVCLREYDDVAGKLAKKRGKFYFHNVPSNKLHKKWIEWKEYTNYQEIKKVLLAS